jgi:hypothetical protein
MIEREGETMERMNEKNTYVVVVRVTRHGVSDLLGRRLLALRLGGRAERVGGALELVTEVLGGRLLRVGLEGGSRLVGEALATGCEGGEERGRLDKISRHQKVEGRRTVRHGLDWLDGGMGVGRESVGRV